MSLEKTTKIGQFLNSWTSIIIVIGGIMTGIMGAYYNIETNTADISSLRIVIEDNNIAITREFEIQSDRADKRNSRTVKELDKHEAILEKIREQQVEILQRLSYLEGKLNK